MNNIYYVYLYLREKDDENGPAFSPYYVGKGKEDRAFSGKHSVNIPGDKSLIRFIYTNISEDDAHMWEVFWISEFGRIDLGLGCLGNKTDGGEGVSGRIFSEKTLSKQSISAKNKPKQQCPHCYKKMQGSAIARFHGNKCLEFIGPLQEGQTRDRSFETQYGKEEADRLKKVASDKSKEVGQRESSFKTCPHCGITVDKRNYGQHHGENCKRNPSYVRPPINVNRSNAAKGHKRTVGKVRIGSRKFPNEKIYEIGRRHLSGVSPSKLAEEYGVRIEYVHRCSAKFRQEVLFGPYQPKHKSK